MIGTVVDTADLWRIVWVSLVAGIGVPAAFAVALLGSTRFAEYRRDGRYAGAAAFGSLGVLAMAAVLGAIAFGIIVLVDK